MKIGVLSDTHDRVGTAVQAMQLLIERGAHMLVHCGDWVKLETVKVLAEQAKQLDVPLFGVLGNNDPGEDILSLNTTLRQPVEFSEDPALELKVEGCKIAVTHGHNATHLRKLIGSHVYDVVFIGHSHKPLITTIEGTLVVNPGSTAFTIPRRHERRSVALYDTDTNTAELIFFDAAEQTPNPPAKLTQTAAPA